MKMQEVVFINQNESSMVAAAGRDVVLQENHHTNHWELQESTTTERKQQLKSGSVHGIPGKTQSSKGEDGAGATGWGALESSRSVWTREGSVSSAGAHRKKEEGSGADTQEYESSWKFHGGQAEGKKSSKDTVVKATWIPRRQSNHKRKL